VTSGSRLRTLRRSRLSSDVVAILLLFGGTVGYLVSLPHNLGPSDESIYLYEAKRLLQGQAMYRDVFDFTMPGWMYLMAGLFRLFGTSIATARTAMAVLHALAAIGIYGACRAAGVRPGLSWPAALAHLVLDQAAWPIASQHWLGSALCVLLLWACLASRGRTDKDVVLPGVLLGLLLDVQQQRAIFMGGGVLAWLVLEGLLDRRYGGTRRPVGRRACWLCGGALASSLPFGLYLVARAGFVPIWQALVVFPFANYAAVTHCPWGDVTILSAWQASFTFPRVLAWMPLAVAPTALRLAWLVARRRGGREARTLLLLLTLCGASALSILYFPDFIHLAFIAPLFLVAAAENTEAAARRVGLPRPWRAVAALTLASAILSFSIGRLADNRARLWRAFPVSHLTAFGRIDYATIDLVRRQEAVRHLVDRSPKRELFCYPVLAELYLTADANDPVPFGFFIASFFRPDQVRQALDILRAKRLPYIVLALKPGIIRDAIFDYVEKEYQPLDPADPVLALIYRRRPSLR